MIKFGQSLMDLMPVWQGVGPPVQQCDLGDTGDTAIGQDDDPPENTVNTSHKLGLGSCKDSISIGTTKHSEIPQKSNITVTNFSIQEILKPTFGVDLRYIANDSKEKTLCDQDYSYDGGKVSNRNIGKYENTSILRINTSKANPSLLFNFDYFANAFHPMDKSRLLYWDYVDQRFGTSVKEHVTQSNDSKKCEISDTGAIWTSQTRNPYATKLSKNSVKIKHTRSTSPEVSNSRCEHSESFSKMAEHDVSSEPVTSPMRSRDTSSKSDTEAKLLWPAWVYCTRYSDRPSAGPRSRKTRRRDKRTDEKRPRTAFTHDQLLRLKSEFELSQYLTEHRRRELSLTLNLSEAQIKIWYQNKRAKIKKTSSGDRSSLAFQLMEQGLYNHKTSVQFTGDS